MNISLENNAFTNKPHNRPYLPLAIGNNTPLTPDKRPSSLIIENNNQMPINGDNINQVWSKHSFDVSTDTSYNKNNNTMSWAEIVSSEAAISEPEKTVPIPANTASSDADQDSDGVDKEDNASPSHHARRPMNAFLIFCKKHRPIVRDNFPSLENRGVTKILGEWWSLLDEADKKPYTDLAKEYKDKFMSDNPGFKWYKLPAPPLRTLNTRPPIVHKSPPPTVSSPISPVVAEFTPGKLADESQLGSLTSLMNNCTPGQKISSDKLADHQGENNNNMSSNGEEIYDNSFVSPVNLMKSNAIPPKPIKKRPYDQHLLDNKNVSRNILEAADISHNGKEDQNSECDDTDMFTMTKQELHRGADDIYTKLPEDINGLKETRKSGRSCKGKRYEQFMVEGKLLGNKRDTKLTQHKLFEKGIKADTLLSKPEKKLEIQTPKVGLESTIKRLAERTNIKINFDDKKPEDIVENKSNDRLRTISETSEDSFTKNVQTSNFNLDLRISELPCLSYAQFQQRKKESKKRKNNRMKHDFESKRKIQKVSQESHLTGAKKRKNKHKITHLNNCNDNSESMLNDLSGLATLAEIAAKTEKLGEQNTSE